MLTYGMFCMNFNKQLSSQMYYLLYFLLWKNCSFQSQKLHSSYYYHRNIVTGLVANLRGNGYMVRFCDIDVDARSFKGDEKQ